MVGSSPPAARSWIWADSRTLCRSVERLETTCAEAVLEAFDAPALQYLVGSKDLRALAADVLTDVRFPQEIWDEMDALKKDDGARYQHAVWTAVVAARLFRTALGTA